MRIVRKPLALLLACAVAVCACGCGFSLERRGAGDSSEPTLAEIRDKSTRFTSKDGRFTITAPNGWYRDFSKENHPNFLLRLCSGDGAVGMTLHCYAKEQNLQSFSLDDFAGRAMQAWEGKPHYVEPNVSKDYVIDGCPARRDGVCEFYDDNPEYQHIRLYSLEYPDVFVCMIFGVSDSDLSKAEKTMDVIAKSIRRTESSQGGSGQGESGQDASNPVL